MDADGDIGGDAMNKSELENLIGAALDLDRQDIELNQTIRRIWKREQPAVGTPLDNAYRRSGANKWALVAGELKQLIDKEGG